MSTQTQKSVGPSQGYDNIIDGQCCQISNISGKIIIKGEHRKSPKGTSHLNRRKEEKEGD